MASTNLICRLEYIDSAFGVSVGKAGATSDDWRSPFKTTITDGAVTETRQILKTSESVTVWSRTSGANEVFRQGFAWADPSAWVCVFTSGYQWHTKLTAKQPMLLSGGSDGQVWYLGTTTLEANTSNLTTSGGTIYQIVMHATSEDATSTKIHFIGIGSSA